MNQGPLTTTAWETASAAASGTARRLRLLRILLLGIISILLVSSCGRESSPDRIVLPPTPILSVRTDWAVVRSPLLKIREEPNNKATVIQYLRTGAIVEVIARSDAEDTVEDEVAYWYRISYDGLKGWVFGAYMEVFDARSKAERFVETMK
jgi:hypothetical protein